MNKVKTFKFTILYKLVALVNILLLLPWPGNTIAWANETTYLPENNLAAGIMGVPGLWAFSQGGNEHGLTGKGQVIAVADSGLDGGNPELLHPDLRDRLVGIKDYSGDGWADPNGHGTHIAGSIVGSGLKSGGFIRGIAPEAGLYFQATYNDKDRTMRIPSVYQLLLDAYNSPGAPRIHVNSWGASFSDGIYDWDCYSLDKFVWDHPDMIVLKSAGNGFKTSKPFVSSPGAAKNAITVGSTEGTRGVDSGSDNPDQVAGFSSRGTFDGRIKPEVVAPGTWILSTRKSIPSLSSDSYIGLYNQHYAYMSGSSMSTALTAGSLALLRQYFQQKGINPSAALMKASLIFGTRQLPGVSSIDQGFGRVDIENALIAIEKGNAQVIDHVGLKTGEKVSYSFTGNGHPFKVVMAYSDYPKTPGLGKDLVNNLDVKVIGPGNKEFYWGNGYIGGDTTNNIEEIIVSEVKKGETYTIEVSGSNILYGPQPFGLIFGTLPQQGTLLEIVNNELKLQNGNTHKFDSKTKIRVVSGQTQISQNIKDMQPGAEVYLVFDQEGQVKHVDAIYSTIDTKIISKEGNRQLVVFDGTRWSMAEKARIFIGDNELNWAALPIEAEVQLTVNPVTARVWRVDVKNLPDNSPYYSLPISDAEVREAISKSSLNGKVILSTEEEIVEDNPVTLAFKAQLASELFKNGRPVELRLPGLSVEIPSAEFSRFSSAEQGAQMQMRVSWQSVTEQSLPSSDPLMYLRPVGKIVEVRPRIVWPDGSQIVVSQALYQAKVTITTPIGSTAGLNIQRLGMYRQNDLTRLWEFINNNYNPDTGKSTITIDKLGKFAVLEASRTFSDIKNHWARTDIEIMAARHVVRGMTPDIFAPNDIVTRGQFTAIMVRTLGLTEDARAAQFKDLPADYWCTGAVGAAVKAGLIVGYGNGNFGANDPVTREQMASMLVRAIHLNSNNVIVQRNLTINFSDGSQISDWARTSVNTITGEGLMVGRDNNLFAPREYTSRAEATAVMVRLLNYLANTRS